MGDHPTNAGAATIVEAKWTADGRPEFEAKDFKELEARFGRSAH